MTKITLLLLSAGSILLAFVARVFSPWNPLLAILLWAIAVILGFFALKFSFAPTIKPYKITKWLAIIGLVYSAFNVLIVIVATLIIASGGH